ncbi:MAG: hypothetical protein CVU44_02475 [Chloroflexi bacterium HGW-Chloroflexi-6]|nr:MAG: hypothetical protein CVU44_02475 [Chloroflexi bacterium HGW-Chloroflexi-6]
MKNFYYRYLLTASRMVLILALLLVQQGPVANAQGRIELFTSKNDFDTLESERITVNIQPANQILDRLPDDFLQFPFPEGTEIKFNGTAHSWNRKSSVISGIDISPKATKDDNGKIVYDPIVAPASGKIIRSSTQQCWVIIDFENGWAVRLVHITNIKPTHVQRVEKNQYIADLAEDAATGACGGGWDGVHVHMDLINYGTKEPLPSLQTNHANLDYAPINGQVFSRWKVNHSDNSTFLEHIDNGEQVGSKQFFKNSTCPTPSGSQIAFYKYPLSEGRGCGEEREKAVYFYDVTDLYKSVEVPLVTIPFTPKAVKFPTKNLDPGSSLSEDKAYLIRSLSNEMVLTAKNQLSYDPWDKQHLKPYFTYWDAPVVQQPWKSLIAQRWLAIPFGNGTYYLAPAINQFCLTGTKKGQAVTQRSCSPEDGALWKLEPINGVNGDFRIRHAESNLVLAVPGSTKDFGAKLILWDQRDGKNQEWHICEATQFVVWANTTNPERINQDSDIRDYGTGNFYIGLSSRCDANAQTNLQGVASSSSSSLACNLAPFSPNSKSPQDGFSQANEAPTLYWSSGGDPEKNHLNFQVEIIGSEVSFTSSWLDTMVWRPTSLDYKYGTYQWRVRARDPELAISPWSATRSFSILSPNGLPTINFQTSNGLTETQIFSRETSWMFAGTASDPEGQLSRIEVRCSGDGCGAQSSHTGLSNWSHTRTGMSGRNEIYFVVYDKYTAFNPAGQSAASRLVTLLIDLAAPVTTPSLNGQANTSLWPAWYNQPVEVRLNAADRGTGNAHSGEQSVHYRLNGGALQTVIGSTATIPIDSDGTHTVEYYSLDKVGNVESTRSFAFQVDRTPPSLPVNLRETNSPPNNVWQNTHNIPTFAWDAATDNLSGVRGYQLYFGSDPNGIGYTNVLASEPLTWKPFPAGVPTGTYYLRARTQDVAGNWTSWATLFTFRYDNTPPENPSDVTHAAGISTDWQKATSLADFSWSVAHDEGSGIAGYYIYWGPNSAGTSATLITANSYHALEPLCAADSACTGYLRVRTVDKVGNLAESWNTVFILRYDNVPPQVNFTFNSGANETSQSLVVLNVDASDQGSGVYAARFSNNGHNWTEWEQPSPDRLWQIPAISRQSWPAYAQVIDGVGLLSEIVRHEIYFDVNPGRPNSSNYRLFDYVLVAGSGAHASDNYSARGTLGQVTDSPVSASSQYTLLNGYEAGSQAIPMEIPGFDRYGFPVGVFGNGVLTPPLQSAQYQLMFTSGGIGLPTTTTIGSTSYHHQPGFLAAVRPEAVVPPSTVQPEMPAPDPKPELTCDAPQVLINDGALYTSTVTVTLSLCAPFAVEMMLSDRDDFTGASWQPFAPRLPWTISTTGSPVEPRFVYARFKDSNGKIHAAYFDDILYDAHRPSGELLLTDDIPLQPESAGEMSAMQLSSDPGDTVSTMTLQATEDGSVALFVDGYDDNSGLSKIQLSEEIAFADAEWQPFSPVANYTPQGGDGLKTVYARFQDDAGNISGITTLQFIYDTQPQAGYLYVDPSVLPVDAATTTLYFGEYSYWEDWGCWEEGDLGCGQSEQLFEEPVIARDAVELRFGFDPNLTDAFWQSFIESAEVPVDPTQPEGTFYVQYRDAAGNISEIYSATYYIDSFAPDVSAAAEPGQGNERTLNIYAYNNLSGVAQLHLDNDPLMQDSVVTQPYTSTLAWTYDERRVVWIVAEDGVGNLSEPYPVYATEPVILEPFVTISGNAGTSGVTLSYVDGEAKVVTAGDTGLYTIAVPFGWSGTVTPSKTGYTFAPENRQYTSLENTLVNQDYVASAITDTTHPGAFDKASPVNGASDQSTSLALLWGSSSGATSYEYCFDTSDDNTCSNWVSVGANTSANLSRLAASTTYYWHVRASNAAGTTYANGNIIAFWSFSTGSPVATFEDVPVTYWAWSFIERLYNAGITGGCATTPNLLYCPDSTVTRAQMAVFLLKSMHGKSYTPPLVGGSTGFGDVATSHWAAKWIKQLAAEGITSGCGGGNYCPEAPVTRAQMAVFLLKAKNGSGYAPPALGDGSGFADVPADYWAARWIKRLAAEGITSGCGAGNYCPENSVTRAQMAVFIVKTFGLP